MCLSMVYLRIKCATKDKERGNRKVKGKKIKSEWKIVREEVQKK